jgi:nucleotide-binding universal stress UspA family protein
MTFFQPKLILVPTDFSEPAAHALRYASALAERVGAHLFVIHADSLVRPIREQLESYVERNISAKVPYDARVVVDEPVNGILDQACQSGADLIVMGTHGRTGLRRLIVGSITEAIIRITNIPVIAVSSLTSETASIRRVLCPVAFNDASREALRCAAALVDARSAPLVLFRGVEGQEQPGTVDELIRLQEWTPRELVDRCEVKIIPMWSPAEQIVEFAKINKSDLIALGVPNDRGLRDVLRSTVADQIVQQSRCPVMVVNVRTAHRNAREPEIKLATV